MYVLTQRPDGQLQKQRRHILKERSPLHIVHISKTKREH